MAAPRSDVLRALKTAMECGGVNRTLRMRALARPPLVLFMAVHRRIGPVQQLRDVGNVDRVAAYHPDADRKRVAAARLGVARTYFLMHALHHGHHALMSGIGNDHRK